MTKFTIMNDSQFEASSIKYRLHHIFKSYHFFYVRQLSINSKNYKIKRFSHETNTQNHLQTKKV